MKSRLSALMDGELEAHELPPVLKALSDDDRLRSSWHDYQLIADAIRGEGNLEVDLSAGVMAALQNEPTVLAPGRASAGASLQWRRPMAVAATIAGVSVVAWMAFSEPKMAQQPAAGPVAAAAFRTPAAAPVAATLTGRMQEFLVAHQTYASDGEMQSGTRYIRTVAAGR